MTWRITSVDFGGRLALNGTFEYMHSPCEDRRITYRAWLLDDGDTRVLVDTGPNPVEATARGITIDRPLTQLLGSEIVQGISHVVLTHAHWDHMGNLHEIPDAQVWMQSKEREFARSSYLKFGAVGDYYGRLDPLDDVANEGRLNLVDGDGDICPGLVYMWTGGHTPGHQIVSADIDSGTAVFCGDLVPVSDNLRNASAPGVFTNLLEVIDGIERIGRINPAEIYTGHDVDPAPFLLGSLTR